MSKAPQASRANTVHPHFFCNLHEMKLWILERHFEDTGLVNTAFELRLSDKAHKLWNNRYDTMHVAVKFDSL